MSKAYGGLSCSAGCWLTAAAAGLVALVLMLALGDIGIIGALFLAGAIFVALGLIFGFLFCRQPAAPPGAGQGGEKGPRQGTAPIASPKPAPEPASAPKPTPEPAPKAQDAAPEPKPDVSAPAGPAVRSGNQLAGQQELAARKGEWTYRGDAAPAAASAAPRTAVPAGDGGTKPEGLAQARGGQPDDLKQIKGVGPKLEKLLNSMGFFHFNQIAAWRPEEVAWVDQNLHGFKGRVSRDAWVAQARTLAAGGETEFSRRVQDGDVYE